MKERFDIIASSLSSYFGVGFNTPEEQLDIDLGKQENIFDDEAKKRMALGNAMEDGCMDYFEWLMNIKIVDRNTKTMYACDGKLKCKCDGMTTIDLIPTGWENKYSNSSSGPFTDDLGYQIQCQAYMMAFDKKQWVLAGMHNGKPIYKLLKWNDELASDIETVVEAVYNILLGVASVEEYPWDIVEKYSKTKPLKELDDLEEYDVQLLDNIAELKKQKKEVESELEGLETYAKEKFSDIKYKDPEGKYSITISTGSRKGGLDENSLSIEHPELDLTKYRKEDSIFKTIRVTQK